MLQTEVYIELSCGIRCREGVKEYEEKILGSEEKIITLETRLFNELILELNEYIPAIQHDATQIARLDCLLSFAKIAKENR